MLIDSMRPVGSAAEVLAAIQDVKSAAPAFCTNFFPDQKKLAGWAANGDLSVQEHPGAVFFFRKDRDFAHFLFCARDTESLAAALERGMGSGEMKLVSDLVGREGTTGDLERILASAGFRPYSKLVRLNRPGGAPLPAVQALDTSVATAGPQDAAQVAELLRSVFDPYRDQLPPDYELGEALMSGQVRVVKCKDRLAALLFAESQGLTSSIRYWGVGKDFRSQGFGAVLMRDYFSRNPSVRRFILWVAAANEDALQKYRHYGYALDGLTDTILRLN